MAKRGIHKLRGQLYTSELRCTWSAFGKTRNLALKIYNTRNVYYKFSALNYVNSVSPSANQVQRLSAASLLYLLLVAARTPSAY